MLIKNVNYLKLSFVAALRTAFGSSVTPAEYRYLENENDPNCKLRIYRAYPRRVFRPPCLVVSAEAGDAKFRYLDDEIVKKIYRVYNEQVVYDNLQVYPVYALAEVKDAVKTYIENTDFTLNYNTGAITWLTPKPTTYQATYDTLKFTDKNQTIWYADKVQSQLRVPIKIAIHALSTTDRERITDLVILYVRHVFRDAFRQFMSYIDISVGGEVETAWDNQQVFSSTVTVDVWTQYSNEIPRDLLVLIQKINLDVEVRNLGG